MLPTALGIHRLPGAHVSGIQGTPQSLHVSSGLGQSSLPACPALALPASLLQTLVTSSGAAAVSSGPAGPSGATMYGRAEQRRHACTHTPEKTLRAARACSAGRACCAGGMSEEESTLNLQALQVRCACQARCVCCQHPPRPCACCVVAARCARCLVMHLLCRAAAPCWASQLLAPCCQTSWAGCTKTECPVLSGRSLCSCCAASSLSGVHPEPLTPGAAAGSLPKQPLGAHLLLWPRTAVRHPEGATARWVAACASGRRHRSVFVLPLLLLASLQQKINPWITSQRGPLAVFMHAWQSVLAAMPPSPESLPALCGHPFTCEPHCTVHQSCAARSQQSADGRSPACRRGAARRRTRRLHRTSWSSWPRPTQRRSWASSRGRTPCQARADHAVNAANAVYAACAVHAAGAAMRVGSRPGTAQTGSRESAWQLLARVVLQLAALRLCSAD